MESVASRMMSTKWNGFCDECGQYQCRLISYGPPQTGPKILANLYESTRSNETKGGRKDIGYG